MVCRVGGCWELRVATACSISTRRGAQHSRATARTRRCGRTEGVGAELPILLTLIGCAAAAAALDQVSKIFVTRRCAEGRFYELRAGCGVRRMHNQRGGIVCLPAGGAAAVLAGVGVLGAALLLGSAVPVKGTAVGF